MYKNLADKQYSALVLIIVVTINFIMLSFVTLSLTTLTAGLLLSFLYGTMFIKAKDTSYKITSYILTIKYIVTAASVIAIFTKIASDMFLRDINKYTILILIFVVSAYCSLNNDSIYRIARLLYIFILLPIISVIIFSVKDIKISNLLYSISDFSFFDMIGISFMCLISEITAVLSGYNQNNLQLKNYFKSVLFSVFIVVLSYVCIVGRFGVSAFRYKYPAFELMYSSDISSFLIQRQEGILIPLFLVGLLVVISIYMFFSVTTKVIYSKYINLIIVFILSVIILYLNNAVEFYIISSITGGIILFIIMLISRRRK